MQRARHQQRSAYSPSAILLQCTYHVEKLHKRINISTVYDNNFTVSEHPEGYPSSTALLDYKSKRAKKHSLEANYHPLICGKQNEEWRALSLGVNVLRSP